jgi:antitoxin component YwqK of YwqJK toxin-antitoxin module
MEADRDRHDSEGELKGGIFKEYFKDGTLACEGTFKKGEKSASGHPIRSTGG